MIGRFINADGYMSTGQDLIGYNMFTYCLNNPINMYDSSGEEPWYYKAGSAKSAYNSLKKRVKKLTKTYFKSPAPLPYKSADDAATAFANQTYGITRYIQHEIGTAIYSMSIDGISSYNYTPPVIGEPHSVMVTTIEVPAGTKKVATAHTHPNNNEFSPQDMVNAHNRGVDNYVIGPNLNVQRYSVNSGLVFSAGTATPNELTDPMKAFMAAAYQISWDNHLKNCNRNCEDKTWPVCMMRRK